MWNIKFSDPREFKKIELPSFKGSEAEIFLSLKVKEQRDIAAKYPKASDSQSEDAQNASIALLVASIKNWNFTTGEKDERLKISMENLSEFPMTDILFMLNIIGEAAQKKK